jgi:hypothetical protein
MFGYITTLAGVNRWLDRELSRRSGCLLPSYIFGEGWPKNALLLSDVRGIRFQEEFVK